MAMSARLLAVVALLACAAGASGRLLALDGGHVRIKRAAAPDAVTVELMVRPLSCLSEEGVLAQHEDNGDVPRSVGRGIVMVDGQYLAWSRDGDGEWVGLLIGRCEANTWAHLVFTQSGNSMRTYFNGRKAGERELEGNQGGHYKPEFDLGVMHGQAMHGLLAYARIWSRALTLEEVLCFTLRDGVGHGGLVAALDFTLPTLPDSVDVVGDAQLRNLTTSWTDVDRSMCSKCDCGSHGSCTSSSACLCVHGWIGERCQTPLSCPKNCSGHGRCDESGATEWKCDCEQLWAGAACDRPLCPADCSGHGDCLGASHKCDCHHGWTTFDCSQPRGCPADCSGHGDCRRKDFTCDCHHGWLLKDCSKKQHCPNDCSGHGTCDESDFTCDCEETHEGVDCSIERHCPADCSGHGDCQYRSLTCLCDEGWLPSNCSQRHFAQTALRFDGKPRVLELPPMGEYDNITLEMWLRNDAPRAAAALRADRGAAVGSVRWELADGRMSLSIVGNRPRQLWLPLGRKLLRTHRWHHVAVTYSRLTKHVQLYVDGQLATTASYTRARRANLGSAWLGGDETGKHSLRGDVDELRVWGRLLSARTLLHNSNGHIAAPADGLLAYFHFDEGSGRIAMDKSGNRYDAILGGVGVADEGLPLWVSSAAPFTPCKDDCNGHGHCKDGVCFCSRLWHGLACELPRCPGRNCAGHGTCVEEPDWHCQCDPLHKPPDCKAWLCPDDCGGHGVCLAGRCRCAAGFTGANCAFRKCPGDCGEHGTCVNGTCACAAGWGGDDCSEVQLCPRNCIDEDHGRCVQGVCHCKPDYTGDDCSWNVNCPAFCSGRGQCVNDVCVCDDGFIGKDCSVYVCENRCSGHGDCVAGRCQCQPGYMGRDCSQSSLWPLSCSLVRHGTKSSGRCSMGAGAVKSEPTWRD
eukprot:PLAT3352.7.p1 GENE.PLAT3352.7~~PLAT3352.7.p1  ORF type:complete len:914 (+),score=358.97 PLAT3352.7:68-2809(+)